MQGIRSDRQSAWRTMDEDSWHCTGVSDQDHPQQKEGQKGTMSEVVWGGLTHICEKKRSEKQRRKERYKHMNAEFQRIARRDKKAFLSDQCKEIEENNRMGIHEFLFSSFDFWHFNFILEYSWLYYTQKSKMAVWGGLTNSCEKKRSEKQRRKGKR